MDLQFVREGETMSAYEDYCRNNIEGNWNKLTPKVQTEIENIAMYYINSLMNCALRCETPIEQLLFVRLVHWIESSMSEYMFYDPLLILRPIPQKEVKVADKNYRIDICVEVLFKGKEYLFAIECDGHNFHEKTKEQVARDKRRERDLQSVGYHVIRFTGSEIWNDPFGRSAEAMRIIEKVSGLREVIDQNISALVTEDEG